MLALCDCTFSRIGIHENTTQRAGRWKVKNFQNTCLMHIIIVQYVTYLDGHVHIVLPDVVSQVHARGGLGHAHDALDVPHRDGHAARHCRGAAQLCVQRRNLIRSEEEGLNDNFKNK